MTPHRLLAPCIASIALASSLPGFADSPRQLAITEAHAENGVIHIIGLNLGSAKPKVTLGTLQLTVVSVTPTKIDALVPPSVADGSYLVTVTAGRGKNGGGDDDEKYDESWLTIGAGGAAGKDGAAGPQGATGPAGPQGIAGPAGLQGVAGPGGKPGTDGLDGKEGARGQEGPVGPAGKDGSRGKDGSDGATGPAGPPGSGGSLAIIDSLGGLPCTVAMCPGTTALAFDPVTSLAILSCMRVPGNYTLHIQGSTSVGTILRSASDTLQFTSDVSGFGGPIHFRGPAAFDLTTGNLCAGQTVTVTLTRSSTSDGEGPLLVQGGTCDQAQLLSGSAHSLTCVVTMNGDQVLTIQ